MPLPDTWAVLNDPVKKNDTLCNFDSYMEHGLVRLPVPKAEVNKSNADLEMWQWDDFLLSALLN